MVNYLNMRNVSLVIKQRTFAQSISFVIKIILPDNYEVVKHNVNFSIRWIRKYRHEKSHC
ncbi:hypothetical protein CUA51_00555 [Shigella boydii]|nr:hypothetical protein CUA51_00555 [Shigella boydii]